MYLVSWDVWLDQCVFEMGRDGRDGCVAATALVALALGKRRRRRGGWKKAWQWGLCLIKAGIGVWLASSMDELLELRRFFCFSLFFRHLYRGHLLPYQQATRTPMRITTVIHKSMEILRTSNKNRHRVSAKSTQWSRHDLFLAYLRVSAVLWRPASWSQTPPRTRQRTRRRWPPRKTVSWIMKFRDFKQGGRGDLS